MVRSQSIKFLAGLAAAVLAAAMLAATAAASTPSVTTEEPTSVTASKATLNGTLETGEYETAYGFQYATLEYYEEHGDFNHNTPRLVAPAGKSKPIHTSHRVTGLESGQTYVMRLAALVYEYNFLFGEILTFTTGHKPRFTAEEFPATIKGMHQFDVLAAGGYGVTCEASWSDELSSESSQLSLGASFSGCEDAFGNSATVNANSCQYVLSVANAGPPYVGGIELACEEEGDAIEIADPGLGITVTIGEQSFADSVGYKNSGEGSSQTVDAAVDAEELSYTCEGVACFLLGSEGANENGEINDDIELQAADGESQQISLGVEGEEVPDLSITGEESGEEANQPRFTAEEFPPTITNSDEASSLLGVLVAGGYGVFCETSLSGELLAASSQLPLGASFSACEDAFGNSATVNANSCRYVLSVANAGPPYVGGIGIACEEEGDAIEIADPGLGITATIGEQTVAESVGYENIIEGESRQVRTAVNAEELSYTCKGGACFILGSEGANENGEISWELELG